MKKYFAVKTMCGHVRRNNYIEITFAIAANSKKDAASIGRTMPRVKHDIPQAIISVIELTYDEYLLLLEENRSNPYLQCKNRQEQNYTCPDIYRDVKRMDDNKDVNYKEKRLQRLQYLFKKRKIYDQYLTTSNYLMLADSVK